MKQFKSMTKAQLIEQLKYAVWLVESMGVTRTDVPFRDLVIHAGDLHVKLARAFAVSAKEARIAKAEIGMLKHAATRNLAIDASLRKIDDAVRELTAYLAKHDKKITKKARKKS